MTVRVEFIPNKSNPPPIRADNPEARTRNKEAREEIREIMKIIKIGQSFKVWGLEYNKVSNIVYGILKDANRGGRRISISLRPVKDFVQVWRSA